MKYLLAMLLFASPAFAQAPPDPPMGPQADVQALTSQLQGAGCNAALNAAAAEIVKLRKQVADLQAKQMIGKSGATKK